MHSESNEPSKCPLLSIVVVTKNRARLFERSLRSIISEVDNFDSPAEIIVIDGQSTDGTVDILQQYQKHLTFWISEKDFGAADAVNKGIAKCRAPLIRLIGDDDELLPGGLNKIMPFIRMHPEYDVIAGQNIIYHEELDGRKTRINQGKFMGELTPRDIYKWGRPNILIPEVCFFRRSVFENVGAYDESLRWWGFLDLFLRICKAGLRIYVFPEPILITYQTVLSDTRSNQENPAFLEEWRAVIRRNAGWLWHRWHVQGGTFNPYSHLLNPLRRLFDRLGFHPKRYLRKFLSA